MDATFAFLATEPLSTPPMVLDMPMDTIRW